MRSTATWIGAASASESRWIARPKTTSSNQAGAGGSHSLRSAPAGASTRKRPVPWRPRRPFPAEAEQSAPACWPSASSSRRSGGPSERASASPALTPSGGVRRVARRRERGAPVRGARSPHRPRLPEDSDARPRGAGARATDDWVPFGALPDGSLMDGVRLGLDTPGMPLDYSDGRGGRSGSSCSASFGMSRVATSHKRSCLISPYSCAITCRCATIARQGTSG